MYQLSIIMASPDIVSPDNEEAVLRVHIGSFSQPLHFDVPGSAFYNETHEPIQNTVIEYHLGFVELYLDSINGNCVWGVQDWTAQGLPLGDEDLMHETNPPEIAGIVVQNGVLDSFDIRLEYIQGTNGSIYVDAVCLSTPTAFALFNPDNPQAHPACAQYRSDMEQRLTSVLTDTYSNTPHEFVRMLYGAEQGLTTGAWRASRYFHQRLFTRTDSMVWLYTASSAWSTIAGSALETADLFRNAASGFYHFPIHWDIPQPQEPMTTYYNKLILEPNHSNLQFTIEQYRRYALARQESSNRDPWIPFIQNHSNIFRDDSVFWDHDPLREPTAAEVRAQCGLALAYRADGVMMFQFSQIPVLTSDTAYWPKTLDTWKQNPTKRDTAMGSIGFLNDDNQPRKTDTNGEDKWDSSKVTFARIRALGQYMIDSSLTWIGGNSWFKVDPAFSGLVSGVMSQQQDAPISFDGSDSVIVETTEFLSANDGRHLCVLNCRTDSTGHRHITVKLRPHDDPTAEWRVTNVESGDVWIVRPSSNPDPGTIAHGFTDYFSPGDVHLYRLEAIFDETTDFVFNDGDPCPDRNIYVEPAATLRLKPVDVLAFAPRNGLYCEGELVADQTVFRGCDSEQTWDGIFSKNGAEVTLSQCLVLGGRVAVGPGSTMTLTESTRFEGTCDTCAVLNALGGSIISSGTIAEVPAHGKYVSCYYGSFVTLAGDSAQSTALTPRNVGVNLCGGTVAMRQTRLLDMQHGVSCNENGWFQGRFVYTDLGRNKLRVDSVALSTSGTGIIDFGKTSYYAPGGWGKQNSFHVEEIDAGYHIHNAGGSGSVVWADSSFWSHGPTQDPTIPNPKTYGACRVYFPLSQNPVPFTSEIPLLSKSPSAPPPQDWEEMLRGAVSNANPNGARMILSDQLHTRWHSATIRELQMIGHWARELGMTGIRDTLLACLRARSDLESKILAAELAFEDSLYFEAAQILESRDFGVSRDLHTQWLGRTAMVAPLVHRGGYRTGIRALADMRTMLGDDPVYRDLFSLYPRLFSGLHPLSIRGTAKQEIPSNDNRSTPAELELLMNYPNPFAQTTSFTFRVHEDVHVRATVHDVLGRQLFGLADGYFSKGDHTITLHSGNLKNGVYYCRFFTDGQVTQKKVLLLR